VHVLYIHHRKNHQAKRIQPVFTSLLCLNNQLIELTKWFLDSKIKKSFEGKRVLLFSVSLPALSKLCRYSFLSHFVSFSFLTDCPVCALKIFYFVRLRWNNVTKYSHPRNHTRRDIIHLYHKKIHTTNGEQLTHLQSFARKKSWEKKIFVKHFTIYDWLTITKEIKERMNIPSIYLRVYVCWFKSADDVIQLFDTHTKTKFKKKLKK
jgi:hypothetical protein